MRASEVSARCQNKTETVCFVSGRRFKIADCGIPGFTAIPHVQYLLHPEVSAGMSETERQAAYESILPKERAALAAERERLIEADAAAAAERESALAAERVRAGAASSPSPGVIQ